MLSAAGAQEGDVELIVADAKPAVVFDSLGAAALRGGTPPGPHRRGQVGIFVGDRLPPAGIRRGAGPLCGHAPSLHGAHGRGFAKA